MRIALLLSTVFALFAFSAVRADTIHVPSEQPTIQAGIDAAVDGDTVLVAPGLYSENIDFKGKSITVKSSEGFENTVINGNLSGPVCLFGTDESHEAVIEGFTMTLGYGSGFICWKASPTIRNNLIYDNVVALGGSGGGGITCYDSDPMIVNNIIYDNGGYRGGGIYCYESSPLILNNTIMMNHAMEYGGGIYCEDSSPTVTNSIIRENEDPFGMDLMVSSGNPVVTYCDIQGGWPGTGNMDEDPLLIDPENGDFHLTWPSPCRETGENTAVIDPYDVEGDPRIAWNGTVDMGADEFYTHLYYTGNPTPGGDIQGKLVGLPGTSPVGLFFGSGVLEPPISTLWGNFHLQSPWILLLLVPIPSDGILVLPATLPLSPTAPYDLPMQALIGLETDSLTNLEVLEVR
jgi:hypothetical protein